jgi:hypothetical protein
MQATLAEKRESESVSGGSSMDTRRNFLTGLLVAGAATGLRASLAAAQRPATVGASQTQAPLQDNRPEKPTAEGPSMPSPEKKALEENEKGIKKKVEQLYQLATDLKAEVDKTDSSKVLSTTMLRKTTEIEKLAKEIRNLSKG